MAGRLLSAWDVTQHGERVKSDARPASVPAGSRAHYMHVRSADPRTQAGVAAPIEWVQGKLSCISLHLKAHTYQNINIRASNSPERHDAPQSCIGAPMNVVSSAHPHPTATSALSTASCIEL
jgi:hypothetical protein